MARPPAKMTTTRSAVPKTGAAAAKPAASKPTVGTPGAAPHVAAAVGVSAVVGGNKPLAKMVEAAMSQAVLDASAEGVTDPDAVRERMMVARRKVMADYSASINKASTDASAKA